MEDEIRPLLVRTPYSLLPWDPQRAKRSGIFILISVTLERFAFYAVVMNLFLYLNKEQQEAPIVSNVNTLMCRYVDQFSSLYRKHRGNLCKR